MERSEPFTAIRHEFSRQNSYQQRSRARDVGWQGSALDSSTKGLWLGASDAQMADSSHEVPLVISMRSRSYARA